MLNVPMLKLEKNNTYLNSQLEQQENNKQLILNIIANINLILNNPSTTDSSSYETILNSANDYLSTISDNIITLERLNMEILTISKELEDLQSDENKNTKSKEFFIKSFSNIKNTIAKYTEKFQNAQKKLDSDNKNFNEFINVNNFKYNFETVVNDEGTNSETYKFTGFIIDNQAEEIVEDIAPAVDYQEVDVEDVAPVTDCSEVDVEAVAPAADYQEVDVEDVAPATDYKEVDVEDVAPAADYKEVDVEDVAPVTDYSEINVENVTSVADCSEVDVDNIEKENNIEANKKIDELTNNFRKMLINLSNNTTKPENASDLISSYFEEISQLSPNSINEELKNLETEITPETEENLEIPEDVESTIADYYIYTEGENTDDIGEKINNYYKIPTTSNITEVVINDEPVTKEDNFENIVYEETAMNTENIEENVTYEDTTIDNIISDTQDNIVDNSVQNNFEDIAKEEISIDIEEPITETNDNKENINNIVEPKVSDNVVNNIIEDVFNERLMAEHKRSASIQDITDDIINNEEISSEISDEVIEETPAIDNDIEESANINEEIPNNETTLEQEPVLNGFGYDLGRTFANNFTNRLNFDLTNNSDSNIIDEEIIQEELLKNKLKKIITAVADNETLIISEKTNKIYLPYKIVELINYIDNYPNVYSSLSDVVEQEFILPFDYFMKHPYRSRFFETYNLIRNRQGRSPISALAYGLKLIHKSNLNPAIIASCKTEEELKNYIYYLDNNRLSEFKAFNIIYQVNPL